MSKLSFKIVLIFKFFFLELKLVYLSFLNLKKIITDISFVKFISFKFFNGSLGIFRNEELNRAILQLHTKKIQNTVHDNSSKKTIIELLLPHHNEYTVLNLLVGLEIKKLSQSNCYILIGENDFINKHIAIALGFSNFIIRKKKNFVIRLLAFIEAIKISKLKLGDSNLMKLKYSGLDVGKATLENYIRFHNDIKNKEHIFFKLLSLSKGIVEMNYIKSIFDHYKFDHFVIGETQFIPHRIMLLYALKKRIRVYVRFGNAKEGYTIRLIKNYNQAFEPLQLFSKKVYKFMSNSYSSNKLNIINKYVSQNTKFKILSLFINIDKKKIITSKVIIKNKIDFNKYFGFQNQKNILILPNVMTDNIFTFNNSAFKNPQDWFENTLSYISKIKNVNWIIKQHPDEESYGASVTIKQLFDKILINNKTANIKMLSNNDKIDNIHKYIDSVIIFNGSAGYEYTAKGIQALLAANSHYENFNFTIFPKTKKQYFKKLQNMSKTKTITKSKIENAKKFYYARWHVTRVYHDYIPKLDTGKKLPLNFFKLFSTRVKFNKKYKDGSFAESFKYQFENDCKHTINLSRLKKDKIYKYNIQNDH